MVPPMRWKWKPRCLAQRFASSSLLEMGTLLNCSKRKIRLPWREQRRDLLAFSRLIWRMGIKKPYRSLFWLTLAKLIWRNPKGLRYSIAMLALYMHFEPFSKNLIARLDKEIGLLEALPPVAITTPVPVTSGQAA